jgi:phospholipid/cholesterol/gamma-HCH transport system substrate-binding protein
MAREINTFRVGLFVLVSAALIIAAIVAWGVIRYASETRTYVTYFNESVQGLDKNSAVKWQGVTIGSVHSIELAATGTFIEIKMKINRSFDVQSDMVVRILSAGITGMSYLNVEPLGERELPGMTLGFTPDEKVIPSYPSPTMAKLMDLMEKRLTEIDMQGISDGMTNALTRLNSVLNNRQWHAMATNMQNTVYSMSRVLEKVDAYVSSEESRQMLNNIEEFTDRINRTIFMVESRSGEVMQSLQVILNNLRSFSEELRMRPAQTLFSEPREKEK